MIRRKIGQLVAASAFALALISTTAIAAFAIEMPALGSEMGNDVQAGQTGETTTANTVDTGAEANVDDGQAHQVDDGAAHQVDEGAANQAGDQGQHGETDSPAASNPTK